MDSVLSCFTYYITPPPPFLRNTLLRNEPLVFAPTKFLSVRNEDPGLARGQNDKNGTEYASNGDFKKFQPRSENLGRGQLITRPNKKQGSAFSKPQPGSTKEIRNLFSVCWASAARRKICFTSNCFSGILGARSQLKSLKSMLGARSAEKILQRNEKMPYNL